MVVIIKIWILWCMHSFKGAARPMVWALRLSPHKTFFKQKNHTHNALPLPPLRKIYLYTYCKQYKIVVVVVDIGLWVSSLANRSRFSLLVSQIALRASRQFRLFSAPNYKCEIAAIAGSPTTVGLVAFTSSPFLGAHRNRCSNFF